MSTVSQTTITTEGIACGLVSQKPIVTGEGTARLVVPPE
jgi:hypothetical protein